MTELIDELPCAALVTNAEGQVLFANAELLALTGRSLPWCLVSPMDLLFPAASRIFMQTHAWPTVLRDGTLTEVYVQLDGQDGSRTPVLLNARRGQFKGATAYIWCFFVAQRRQEFEAAVLDARKRAEASLRLQVQSERFTRSVADLIPGLVAFWDQDLICRFANNAHLEWFGKDPDSLVGSHLRDLIGADLLAACEHCIQGALAGQAQTFEHVLTKPSGQRGHTLTHLVPQLGDGQVTGFLVLLTDITSLKQAEAALQSEATERQLALDQLGRSSAALMQAQRLGRIGSWSWQVQGDVVSWSDELFGILGCDPGQGAPSFDQQAALYRPESFARLQAMVARALASGESYALDLAYVRSDGVTGWVEARGECVRGAQGAVLGLQGTVQDITARYLADQKLAAQSAELKRSNEELERFAYVASHDLQEPLRMVSSYGELLTRRHLADLKPEAQEFVAYMVDGGQRAQALIRDLLSLARLDSQSMPWAPVSLQQTLSDVLRPLQLKIQQTGAQISHDPLPTVVGDSAQLGQLLANLVGNALKFCGQAAPQVHVAAVREGSGWRISVRDNGIGIEPRHFERIFQMFQRLHLRADYEGTGIGLAICRKVVERHGGQMGVASAPGQGSTFFFTLPDPLPNTSGNTLIGASTRAVT